jgi:hypothetical protein
MRRHPFTGESTRLGTLASLLCLVWPIQGSIEKQDTVVEDMAHFLPAPTETESDILTTAGATAMPWLCFLKRSMNECALE